MIKNNFIYDNIKLNEYINEILFYKKNKKTNIKYKYGK